MIVRYGVTTILVGACFLLLLGMHEQGPSLGFFLMYPAIVLAAIIFDRSSGIYASALSTFLLYLLAKPYNAFLLPSMSFVQLGMFFLFSLALAIISDGLRSAWERAATAERNKDLLLQELSHRTKNNLAMVASMLSLQARLKENSETKRALEKAVLRVQAMASAHDHFQPFRQHGRIEMQSYLNTLGRHLGDTLRDVKPIAVKVDAERVHLRTEQAISVGLIVNELVTNSFKHAFPDDRGGSVEVSLRSDAANWKLWVADDGVGCPATRQERLGSRLTRLLAAELGGSIEWEQRQQGCAVVLRFPADLWDAALPKAQSRVNLGAGEVLKSV